MACTKYGCHVSSSRFGAMVVGCGMLGLGGEFGNLKHGLGTQGLWDIETHQNQNIGCIVGHVLSNWKSLAVQLNASTIAPTLKIGCSHDMKA
jgi:hypothetical protein